MLSPPCQNMGGYITPIPPGFTPLHCTRGSTPRTHERPQNFCNWRCKATPHGKHFWGFQGWGERLLFPSPYSCSALACNIAIIRHMPWVPRGGARVSATPPPTFSICGGGGGFFGLAPHPYKYVCGRP